MSKSYIKYPVAFNISEDSLVEIKHVTNQNRLKLSCPECKNSFIAVSNHKTPHFKHKPNSICSGSPESYLHWLTKEVFKEITEIEIPKLVIDDLPEKSRQNFQLKYNKIIDLHVPESLRSKFKKSLKKELYKSKKLSIENCYIEKEFNTTLGSIIVDVILEIKTKKIFIEPFLSNPIDEEKKKKLKLLNIPTFSIDLAKFIDGYGQNYTLQSLKKYLFLKISKKWVHISEDKCNVHIQNYEKYLLQEIEKNKNLIESHKKSLCEIDELENKVKVKYSDIKKIQEEINSLNDKVIDLKEKLGINYY
ncbi:hypothetical protein [Cellulophaga sp. Asnod2-G02]|uniref:hypothetical protein n=1 Tax=Cellulophaga sp. Asnod2-G02 TaxID=3160572 RepID=UPI003865501E